MMGTYRLAPEEQRLAVVTMLGVAASLWLASRGWSLWCSGDSPALRRRLGPIRWHAAKSATRKRRSTELGVLPIRD